MCPLNYNSDSVTHSSIPSVVVLQVVELIKFEEAGEVPEIVETEIPVTLVKVGGAVELVELVVSSSKTQI
jgi:hypothetical protein